MSEAIDTADVVHHTPTGEDWIVACVRGDRLSWCGWPEGMANLADCVLKNKATPEERGALLRSLAAIRGNDHRATYARERLAREATEKETMSNSGLTFNALRGANAARLPQFKNKHGGQAHSKPDGSDWAPAQWLEALVGEVGEFASARLQYELGLISFDEYRVMADKELADIQTYLDILAKRALDQIDKHDVGGCPTNWLMLLVAQLGEHANAHKKLVRGDVTFEQFDAVSSVALMQATDAIGKLRRQATYSVTPAAVTEAHPTGVDLGQATIDKFNEVSERVGSSVRLHAPGWRDEAQQKAA